MKYLLGLIIHSLGYWLIYLKVQHLIDWSWLVVLLPIYYNDIVIVVMFILLGIKKYQEAERKVV